MRNWRDVRVEAIAAGLREDRITAYKHKMLNQVEVARLAEIRKSPLCPAARPHLSSA